MKKLLRSCALSFLLLALVTACADRDDTALLTAPQVGDLYAGELSHFAAFEHEGEAYGLMKVVAVTGGSITVVTDSSAWPNKGGAVNDLRGDQSGVKWDEQNTVRIARAELQALYQEDRIFGVRRPRPGK